MVQDLKQSIKQIARTLLSSTIIDKYNDDQKKRIYYDVNLPYLGNIVDNRDSLVRKKFSKFCLKMKILLDLLF